MKSMKEVTYKVAKSLIKANGSATTVSVKKELETKYPEFRWNKTTKGAVLGVTDMMTELVTDGKFAFDGSIYSIPSKKIVTPVKVIKVALPVKVITVVKVKNTHNVRAISRTAAHKLMSNNKGQFFTATFINKKGEERVMSCTYLKDQTGSVLGYVKVKDTCLCKKTPTNCIRNVNLQTLTRLAIGGATYKVR